MVTASPEFDQAINNLLESALIKQDGLYYSVHRVVQEATSYHDVKDLQASFDTASKLVNEQFPKRKMNETYYERWSRCQEYVPHGVHLSKKFADHAKSAVLRGTPAFVELLSNCGWYGQSLTSKSRLTMMQVSP